ncbi:MAG: APC family permease [Gemmataceae bacterium]
MGPAKDQSQPIQAQLGLWDAVSIIVGIVIGASIFKTPPLIMNNVATPWMGLGVWALGGLLSLIGALCYAELATAYPRSGGDYVYLTRAFGPWCGFLFGWAQLAILLTSSTGMMGFIFADYAVDLWSLERQYAVWFALAAVTVLTAMNLLGVMAGKWTQNILSLAKVLGLVGIAWAGFAYGSVQGITQAAPQTSVNFGLAMIFVLYAYGGWNDAAFVAAEIRRRRNIARCLILGTLIITLIYLLVNTGYLMALGFDGVRGAETAVAAAVLRQPLGAEAAKAMNILVMISALGAINGLIFTGSRVYSSMGADYRFFSLLGQWHPRLKTPIYSLLAQWVICVLMIFGVGTQWGRDAINAGLVFIRLEPLPWDKYFGGFDTLLAMTAPVFWAFFLLTGLSLFALRQRDPDTERPFLVPLFPVLPLIFCGTCFFMMYSALDYAGTLALFGAFPLLIGLLLYYASPERRDLERLPAPTSAQTDELSEPTQVEPSHATDLFTHKETLP